MGICKRIMRFVRVVKVDVEDCPEPVQEYVRKYAHLNPIVLKHDDVYTVVTPYYEKKKRHPVKDV